MADNMPKQSNYRGADRVQYFVQSLNLPVTNAHWALYFFLTLTGPKNSMYKFVAIVKIKFKKCTIWLEHVILFMTMTCFLNSSIVT